MHVYRIHNQYNIVANTTFYRYYSIDSWNRNYFKLFLNMSDKIIYNGIAWLIIILVPIGIISGLLAGCYTYRHIEEVLNNSKLSQIRNDVDILKIRRRYASNRFVSVYLSISYSIPIILIYRISIGILLTSI